MIGDKVIILTLVLASFVHGQLFDQISMNDRRHDFQFRESGRQLMAIQDSHHRNFRKIRENNRKSPNEWGAGDFLVRNAIFMGEVSCRFLMDFAHMPSYGRRNTNDFQVTNVEVFDDITGEQYPVQIKENDFVAYHKNLSHVHKKRPITIRIKHTGCIDADNTCDISTTYSSSFRRNGHVDRFSFVEMNVATKPYDEYCSILKKIFNFWPFNRFFN